ncbi:hypothetical protein [Cellvibrio sp.]|uniref:hypothetical protein n=1 Tax=Cellvibrio sp. TaxID=1965322 RepID=UPI00396489CF
MKSKHIKIILIVVASTLVLFCLTFGLPIIGGIAASKITALAGCTKGSFDMPPQCASSIINDRFAPLAGWVGMLLTPIFFAYLFWDWLLVWGLLCAGLFLWWNHTYMREQKEAQYTYPFGDPSQETPKSPKSKKMPL